MSHEGGPPRLVELCIDVACGSKESVQAWRRQKRTLERLPPHLAHPLFDGLHHGGLLTPPLLELFEHSMEEVIVSGDGSINAEWTAYLKSFQCLRAFKAANCRSISNFAISHLKGLETLQELNLSGCPKINDEGLSHDLGLTNLQRLGLSETRVTAKGIESLSVLKGLTSLDLGAEATPRMKESPNARGINSGRTRSPAGSSTQSVGHQKNKESLAMFSDERIKFSRSDLFEIRKEVDQNLGAGSDNLPPLLSMVEEIADLFKAGSM